MFGPLVASLFVIASLTASSPWCCQKKPVHSGETEASIGRNTFCGKKPKAQSSGSKVAERQIAPDRKKAAKKTESP
jgi:hypothetical protein